MHDVKKCFTLNAAYVLASFGHLNIELLADVDQPNRMTTKFSKTIDAAGDTSVTKTWLRYVVVTSRLVLVAALTFSAFYLSLVSTTIPVNSEQRESIDRAIDLLSKKGFDKEAFLLGHAATFRGTDNWLNSLTTEEGAFAATNFPFEIVTVYPDFFSRTVDDTERAMILLHEAQHMLGKDDRFAYAYVWKNRERLGWTTMKYGTSATYVSVELQTRENSPELFSCTQKVWNDCTETLLRGNIVNHPENDLQ